MPTSSARCAKLRNGLRSKQCAGIALRTSLRLNGGAADRSKEPSCGGGDAGEGGRPRLRPVRGASVGGARQGCAAQAVPLVDHRRQRSFAALPDRRTCHTHRHAPARGHARAVALGAGGPGAERSRPYLLHGEPPIVLQQLPGHGGLNWSRDTCANQAPRPRQDRGPAGRNAGQRGLAGRLGQLHRDGLE